MTALGAAFGTTTDYPSVVSPLAVGGALGNIVEMIGGFGWVFMLLSCVISMASRSSDCAGLEGKSASNSSGSRTPPP